MGLEIERRFLVTSDGWKGHAGPPQPLRQGYLASSADGVTVRMRLRGEDQAWLTLKAQRWARRHIWATSVSRRDRACACRLEKSVALDLQVGVVVDCLEANAPAPWRGAGGDADLEIPDWCGRELTEQGRWSNGRAGTLRRGSSGASAEHPGSFFGFPLGLAQCMPWAWSALRQRRCAPLCGQHP